MQIIIGSGKVYIKKITGSTMPTDAEIEVDANLIGGIKDGAELSYTPTYYKAKDDSGKYTRQIITNEEVTLKTKVIAFDQNIFKYLTPTATITTTAATTTAAGKHHIVIGGVDNASDDVYAVSFVADHPDDAIERVTIKGINTAGMTLAFAPENATEINAEFDADPQDTNGHLVAIDWNIPMLAQ